jgi:hypothetical protein
MRSTRLVTGFRVQGNDGISGHVADFGIDAEHWVIRSLVVKTGHRLSGKNVQLATSKVLQIDDDESLVSVSTSCESIELSPESSLARVGAV